MARPRQTEENRATIVNEALLLLDEEGPAGLSMRRLAARLGMRGPSLYHYFPTKEAILDAINDQISDAIDIGECASWQEAVRSFGQAYRAAMAHHPNAVALLVSRPVTSLANPGTLRLYERQLERLVAFGWPLSLAWQSVMTIEALVLGDALQAGAPELAIDDENVRASFPLVADAIDRPQPAAAAGSDAFELGLEAMIAGIADRLRVATDA